MSAGAISTFGAWIPAFLSFLLPCLLPIVATLLFADSSEYWASGLGAGFYFSALLILGSNYQARIKEAIFLKLGNAKLVEDLSQQNVQLRTAKEQAEAANGVKSEFLSRVSHELRTPMNGVLGSMQVLRASQLSKQQIGFCNNIQGSAESLLSIINEVLEFAELDAHATNLANDRFDVRALLEQVVKENERKAGAKSLTLTSSCDEHVPQHLIGDAERLRKVLRNLVDNAIKFTEAGFVSLKLHLVEQAASRCQVEFSVQDSGVGIGVNSQGFIFDSFSQADNTSTRNHDGVGLGLTIAQRWVDLMGGKIEIKSEVGVGSRFSFRIWVDNYKADSSTHNDGHVLSLDGARILVVEDSEINQAVVEALLEAMGCDVTIAENGKKAVDALKADSFQLVLMDCQMPVMDGYEATREIRELDVQSDITILALTANAMPGDREKCLQAGMDDYISKPFEATELERIIRQHLSKSNTLMATDYINWSVKTMTSENNDCALDAAVLENLRLLDKGKGLICRVIDAFDKSIPALMSELETGVAELDAEKIRMPAHTMKSSAANLGALAFSNQCAALETMAREGNLTDAQAEFETLQKLLIPVQAELALEKERAEARKAA